MGRENYQECGTVCSGICSVVSVQLPPGRLETKSKQQLYMNNIIYLHLEPLHVNTLPHEMLNINNKICKLYVPSKKEWIYFRLVEETNTTFSGIRLQQDRYNITKFYLTDEKNKWHGILADQAFSKGRWIYVCD